MKLPFLRRMIIYIALELTEVIKKISLKADKNIKTILTSFNILIKIYE